MTPLEEQIRDAIAEQAGEWFVANQTGPLDQQGRTDFVAWLRTSPVHVEEYLGVALIARDLRTGRPARFASANGVITRWEDKRVQHLAAELGRAQRFHAHRPLVVGSTATRRSKAGWPGRA